jgi:hypothetical protein
MVVRKTQRQNWPTLPGKDKTLLTTDQSEEIQGRFRRIAEAVNKAQPDYKVVSNPHPKLMLKG